MPGMTSTGEPPVPETSTGEAARVEREEQLAMVRRACNAAGLLEVLAGELEEELTKLCRVLEVGDGQIG